jgi:hypothetical protein
MASTSARAPSSRLALWGALSAVLFAFPLAALCALFYRFPIPFGGYQSGLDAAPRALLAAVFYGLFGGFPVLALGGYFAGALAARREPKEGILLMLLLSALVALAGVIFLAVLDKLIGPW